jgi:transcriptional regulator with XRE-family HTH domain
MSVATSADVLGVNILRKRLGAALQKHRLQRGLTQAELAEFADLSLKYVGEIERGAANTTLEVLERLAAAVGWNPMDALEGLREPLSEGVRVLLLDEMRRILDSIRDMTKWLQALDPALQPQPPRTGGVPAALKEEHRRLGGARPSRKSRQATIASRGPSGRSAR